MRQKTKDKDQSSRKSGLQTILSHAGVASRRSAVTLIEDGHVRVDGVVVRDKGLRLVAAKHKITVNNKLVIQEKAFYFLLNKPKDVISTAKDTHDRKTVIDFFVSEKSRIYPIGRLDKDTTGIIIMTNDGDLCHKLSHPSLK